MSGDLKIFDLNRLTIVVAGIPISGGYGDADVIKIERSGPLFTTKMGADGDVTRSKSFNKHAKITLYLMQSSTANALLSAQANLDFASDNGAGVGPLAIADLGGATLYAAPKSWIAEAPSPTFSREAEVREWIVECSDLSWFEGGN